MKNYFVLFALTLLGACTPDITEEVYTYTPPNYYLKFAGPENFVWEIDGQKGTADSLNVTGKVKVNVRVQLDKPASISCTLYKGQYPTFYYITSCTPDSIYEFEVPIIR